MGEAQNNHITPQKNGHPRDLMQRFIPGNYFPRKLTADEEEEEEEEEIELSLGLSLNGRFGIDPKRENTMLTRSSSISDFMLTTTTTDHNNTKAARVAEGMAYAPLIRTCSLPTETEEEWRKRKEIQSMRRMEAKRKRLEKMKNVRTTVVRDQMGIMISGVEANGEENVVSQGPVAVKGSTRGGGADGLPPQPSSQGSIGSRGSGSSGISESETQPTQPQGMNICTEDRSPANDQSLPMQNEQKPVVTAPGTATGKSVKLATENNEAITRNMMADMPCVSTRGVGPNGKRIEGFLYRYRKGEEVRIVCVCHGSFLTPAEFVKHAGGGDVDHPLKHIVVSPSPLL